MNGFQDMTVMVVVGFFNFIYISQSYQSQRIIQKNVPKALYLQLFGWIINVKVPLCVMVNDVISRY